MSAPGGLSRRQFLQVSGALGGGMVVGFWAPLAMGGRAAGAPSGFAPNAYVRVLPDNSVTILVDRAEMGQGVFTALPMLIAEEMDADWASVQVEAAPSLPGYGTFYGEYLTGGSSSVRQSWPIFRKAGATARAMLTAAAAEEWGVLVGELETESGQVHHRRTGRVADYGALAGRAATLEVPEEVKLKEPSAFRLIGRNVARKEGPEKVTGAAQFGLDVSRPGQRTAIIARSPVCGGTVRHFDPAPALAIAGVDKVKEVPSGVAVIAKDFWTAKRGRDALRAEFDDGPGGALNSLEQGERYRSLLDRPGLEAENVGDAEATIASTERTLEAIYEVPYLAHAPMEPLSCTAEVSESTCDIWTGTQSPSIDQQVAGRILGREPESIRVHATLLGGGFGRRANATSDFVADAVAVAAGEAGPIQTVWTREEDIRCGYYRPMFSHRVRAALDADGLPLAWHQRMAGQSVMMGTPWEGSIENGIDELSVEGAAHMHYDLPHRRVELHSTDDVPIPVLWWRSVGHSHTAFAVESFVDEIAHAGGRDPFELRLKMLGERPRHRQVLELAAERAGWGRSVPQGRALGLAMHESYGTVAAQVAEVSIGASGRIRVHKVVCAIDCGIAVNPWNIEAQVESAIVYGLSAALYGELTVEKGRVMQSNFHDYRVLRMDEMPAVEVDIVRSAEAPTGVGEPGVPPIAPAVANAIFRLTGQRLRRLPLRLA